MHEKKMAEAWRVMRIQSELVDGIEKLIKLGPAVTLFGSARFTKDNPYYESARALSTRFAQEGLAVITGGGPGIMEAANKGAYEAGGHSVGLNIRLPYEQKANSYQNISLDFRYFFVRKFIFLKHAVGFVIYPGGFGTMDELFEVLTLVQTCKVRRFPIVLVGKSFWEGLLNWMCLTMEQQNACINKKDLDLLHLVDSGEEAAEIILQQYHKYPASLGEDLIGEKGVTD
jgi:uncharacterized protein (TIGR00730 family)